MMHWCLKKLNITLTFAKSEPAMKENSKTIIFYTALIVLTTIIKLVCAPNLALSGTTGLMALALFAGFGSLQKKDAFLLPVIGLLVGNTVFEVLYRLHMYPIPGFYSWQFIEYALLGVALTLIGMALRKRQAAGVFAGAFVGPVVFFLVSNFIVWLSARHYAGGYSDNFSGVMDCYAAGLPFFRNSIISTVVLLPVFIIGYNWFVKGKTLSLFSKA
jgi:hypothetical protein